MLGLELLFELEVLITHSSVSLGPAQLFFFSDWHPPSLLLRLYHLTCLRICQGPLSS